MHRQVLYKGCRKVEVVFLGNVECFEGNVTGTRAFSKTLIPHELGTLNTGCCAVAKDLTKFLSCVSSIGYLRSIMSLAKRPK